MFSNGAGRSYGGGVVHIVSQEPQSNSRHPQKSPNPQTWEMWANMFHTKICNHNCWSEVAGPIHRGFEKPQKPTNLQPHLCAFGQIQKKLHFCNTCACCCCLSKKKFFLLSAIPLQSEIRERLHKNLVSVLIQVFRWKCYLSQNMIRQL